MNKEEIAKKAAALCGKVNKLNSQMHDYLVSVIKECGGFLRVEKQEDKCGIFAYVMDYDTAATSKYPILALAVFNGDQLGFLPDYSKGWFTIKDIKKDDVLELDDWRTIFGGDTVVNATLYSITESIAEYLECGD